MKKNESHSLKISLTRSATQPDLSLKGEVQSEHMVNTSPFRERSSRQSPKGEDGRVRAESGNVLIFVLIAIALLGGLTALLSRSGSSTNETGDYEQTSIAVSDMLRYVNGLERAVDQLRQRGCSENQLSFQYDADSDGDYNDTGETPNYHNTNAPADLSCHIFHQNGGGQTWEDSPSGTDLNYRIISTSLINQVPDPTVSAGNNELLIYVGGFDLEACNEINRQADKSLSTPPTHNGSSFLGTTVFTGSLGSGGSALDCNDGTGDCIGIKTACLNTNSTNAHEEPYIFYHVLLARR